MENDRRYSRLIELSRKQFYNAFESIEWPDTISHDQYWMSPELLTIAGTELERQVSEAQRVRLSQLESVHLYSITLVGERDACQEVLNHIDVQSYSGPSEYLHHFIEEENKHMWFFAQFCRRYAGKIYANRVMKFSLTNDPKDIQRFNLLAQIMVFEEISDFFNTRIERDERLPEIVRTLNGLHHRDEARHLAMNRVLLADLHRSLRKKVGIDTLKSMEEYIKRYMSFTLEQLYNPTVYREAGLEQPYEIRRLLCANPVRRDFHRQVMRRVTKFFVESEIFQTEEFYGPRAAVQ